MSLRSEVVRIYNELLAGAKKITALPSASTPLDGTELVEIVQDGINKKVASSELGGGGGSGTVESVTGDGVDNTDPDNPVLSFPEANEVPFTPAGTIAATNVQTAIEELDSEKQTAAQVQAIADAKVADAINNGTTTIAPSQNAVFDALALKLDKSGDTMSGNLAMGGNKVTGLAAASGNGEAVRYEQVTPAVQTAIDLKVTESNRQQFMLVNTLRSLYNY